MSTSNHINDLKLALLSSLTASFLTYIYLSQCPRSSLTTKPAPTQRKKTLRSTTQSGSKPSDNSSGEQELSGFEVYETVKATHEYIHFHYAPASELSTLVTPFVKTEVLQFPKILGEICNDLQKRNKNGGLKALDIGCAVGRSTFEMSRFYSSVTGIDFSGHFIDAANVMKNVGTYAYENTVTGSLTKSNTALLPEGVNKGNVKFLAGDACNMGVLNLGKFDCILAANLLCRVPDPRKFLRDVGDMINKDGCFVLVSPFSWLVEYTPKEAWIGGTASSSTGEFVSSESEVVKIMELMGFKLERREDIPFLIREHERKSQIGVSCLQVWRKTV